MTRTELDRRLTNQAFVSGNDDARIGLLTAMASVPQPGDPHEHVEPLSAGGVILSGLLELPAPGADFDPYRPLFACLLLSHLVRNSEHAKKLAREVSLPSGDSDSAVQDDDDRVNLVQLIVGNLMMAGREQTECANRAAREGKQQGSTEEEDWTRVMVGYLVLLCTWLWDSPKTVKDFLSESANLQVVSRRPNEMRLSLTNAAHTAHHTGDRHRPSCPGAICIPAGCVL